MGSPNTFNNLLWQTVAWSRIEAKRLLSSLANRDRASPKVVPLRLNIGAFMHTLYAKGAFQGRTPRDAYFVKCDAETTTQNDIDLGRVNIVVGFAPLKPAEFVIVRIQQIAGAILT